jgi:hypothetical protein
VPCDRFPSGRRQWISQPIGFTFDDTYLNSRQRNGFQTIVADLRWLDRPPDNLKGVRAKIAGT